MSPAEDTLLAQAVGDLAERLEAAVEQLDDRQARIEAAVIGDPEIGHRGLVARVVVLEERDMASAEAHNDIDKRRREGDETLTSRMSKMERRWDRITWVGLGTAAGSGLAGAGLMTAATQIFGGG